MDAIPARRFSLANASGESMKLWRFLGMDRRGLRPVRLLGYVVGIPTHILFVVRRYGAFDKGVWTKKALDVSVFDIVITHDTGKWIALTI